MNYLNDTSFSTQHSGIIVVYLSGGMSIQATKTETFWIRKIVGNGVTNKLKVNVPAREASIGLLPYGIVQSKNGDLYFCAAFLHTVLKVEFNKLAGTSNVTVVAGTGSGAKGDENKLATESALNSPSSVWLFEDQDGKVTSMLIVDSGNHRIRKLDMTTGLINTIAGTGDKGSTGDGGSATAATFNTPRHVHIDKTTGDMFIVDYMNHKIRRVSKSDGKIQTVVGNKKCSETVNYGDGGQAIDACLNFPSHLLMNDAGEWIIADTTHGTIRKVDIDGKISTIAGGGGNGTIDDFATKVKLTSPMRMDFTPSGELLVSDSLIRKMDANGFMKILAGGGTSTADDIPAKTASITPLSVAYARDGTNDIFVGDMNGYIHKLYFKCYDIEYSEASVCSGHGSCVAPDQCDCNDGWTGHDCSIASCFDVMSNETSVVCSGHGSCIAPDNCTCDDGWIESNCSIPSIVPCFGIYSDDTYVCSGHGSCIGEDRCKCDNGWMGVDCSITHCFGVTSNHPDVCSGNGKCVSHNKCRCADGFRGHCCQR